MLSVYSDDHRLYFSQSELVDGKLQLCFEIPSRVDTVLARARSQNPGKMIAPKGFGRKPLLRIHDVVCPDFPQGAWVRWIVKGYSDDLVSTTFPDRRLRRNGLIPMVLVGELSYYSFDTEAPTTAGIWQAIYSSTQVALTAQEHMRQGARSAFALCRPPGRHAGGDFMGDYRFSNNAAIATQAFFDQSARHVAVLDIDYHHGNGTQDIFYRRDDVLFAPVRDDPQVEHPYLLDCANECGEDAGKGCNHNYPLAHGNDWDLWSVVFDDACVWIAGYAPDALVISLGVNAYKEDLISRFKLDLPDYLRMGEHTIRLGLPTLFIIEGGYAVEAIGINATNVPQGYEGVAR